MNITLKIADSPSHNMKYEYSYAKNKIYKLGFIHTHYFNVHKFEV